MKRIIAIVAALALLLALAGCSANNGTKETTAPASASTAQADETKTDTPEKASGSKALVVYFSRTGEQYTVGVIDSGYRGEVLAKFRIAGSSKGIDAAYEVGERICQLVIMKLPDVEMVEAEELSGSGRGTGGYGSTGR